MLVSLTVLENKPQRDICPHSYWLAKDYLSGKVHIPFINRLDVFTRVKDTPNMLDGWNGIGFTIGAAVPSFFS